MVAFFATFVGKILKTPRRNVSAAACGSGFIVRRISWAAAGTPEPLPTDRQSSIRGTRGTSGYKLGESLKVKQGTLYRQWNHRRPNAAGDLL